MHILPDEEKTREQLLEELRALRGRNGVRRGDAVFRGLVEAAPDALVIVDPAGTIVLVNSETERMFGYGRQELIDQPVEVLLPPRFRVRHIDQRNRFLADARVRRMGEGQELLGRRKNGEEFRVEIGLSPVPTDEGVLVIAAVRDITRRERVLADLRKAEARYRSLVEEIPAVTFMAALDVADGGRNELYVSPQIAALLGFTQKEWLEDPVLWYRQLHPDDRERWNTDFAPTCAEGKAFSSVYRFLARDGRVVWVQGEAKVVGDDDGRPLFLQGVAFDITAMKEAEEQLRLLNQTLEERVRERTALAEERAKALAQTNDYLRDYAYVSTHDLRQPLRGIIRFAGKLADHVRGQLDDADREILEKIVHRADGMWVLIEKLREYSRVGTERKSFAAVDFSEVFAAACASLSEEIEESTAQVTSGVLPRLWGVKWQLIQLLQNLIGNALKFRSARPPRIRVEAREQGDDWLVTVTDNGIGIEPKYFQKIFGLGIESRLHNVWEYPGDGIGLAFCEKIVQCHGGRIWADSPGPGQGATFAFTLAARPPAAG